MSEACNVVVLIYTQPSACWDLPKRILPNKQTKGWWGWWWWWAQRILGKGEGGKGGRGKGHQEYLAADDKGTGRKWGGAGGACSPHKNCVSVCLLCLLNRNMFPCLIQLSRCKHTHTAPWAHWAHQNHFAFLSPSFKILIIDSELQCCAVLKWDCWLILSGFIFIAVFGTQPSIPKFRTK